MTQANLDQYATLHAVANPTAEQTAVLNALVAVSLQEGTVANAVTPVPAALAEVNDVLEDTQEALAAHPAA